MRKHTEDELVSLINKAIAELVKPKPLIQKAFNYYNGYRDAEQFRALEENYGLGNPTSVEFIPLIRKHIDALVGEYLETPILPKITCKDKGTLTNIARDKQLKIAAEVFKYLKGHLTNTIISFFNGKDMTDKSVDAELKKIVSELDRNFVSEYEMTAQNLIEYAKQSRSIDLLEKLRVLFKDLLIAGYAYFKVRPTAEGNNFYIEVNDPRDVFEDENPESIYVKDGYRIVVRKWMNKAQILNKYGGMMDKDAIKELEDLYEGAYDSTTYYVRSLENVATGYPATDGLQAGTEVSPGYPGGVNTTAPLIPVYEVEWVETDREGGKYVMERYGGVRIGESIFIHAEKDDGAVRTQDNPTMCKLSTNGIRYTTRGNEAYSLVLACANLQDWH